MPLRFTGLTLAECGLLALALIGRGVDKWHEWKDHLQDPTTRCWPPIVWALIRRRRSRAAEDSKPRSDPLHDQAVEGDRPRRRAGADRALPGLQLSTPHLDPLVAAGIPTTVIRARQQLRGRAPCGVAAARRPAKGDRGGADHLRRPQGRGGRLSCPGRLRRVLQRPIVAPGGHRWRRGPGLLAGAAATFVADRRPQVRGEVAATAADALPLRLAQAAAHWLRRLPERSHAQRRPLARLHPPAVEHARARRLR